jgi:hypothetical protein
MSSQRRDSIKILIRMYLMLNNFLIYFIIKLAIINKDIFNIIDLVLE